MALDDWNAGVLCESDNLPFCQRCKPKPYPPTVYISTGSTAFHSVPDCEKLLRGQEKVEERGGSRGAVSPTNLEVAIGKGHLPCLGCFPASRGRV